MVEVAAGSLGTCMKAMPRVKAHAARVGHVYSASSVPPKGLAFQWEDELALSDCLATADSCPAWTDRRRGI